MKSNSIYIKIALIIVAALASWGIFNYVGLKLDTSFLPYSRVAVTGNPESVRSVVSDISEKYDITKIETTTNSLTSETQRAYFPIDLKEEVTNTVQSKVGEINGSGSDIEESGSGAEIESFIFSDVTPYFDDFEMNDAIVLGILSSIMLAVFVFVTFRKVIPTVHITTITLFGITIVKLTVLLLLALSSLLGNSGWYFSVYSIVAIIGSGFISLLYYVNFLFGFKAYLGEETGIKHVGEWMEKYAEESLKKDLILTGVVCILFVPFFMFIDFTVETIYIIIAILFTFAVVRHQLPNFIHWADTLGGKSSKIQKTKNSKKELKK